MLFMVIEHFKNADLQDLLGRPDASQRPRNPQTILMLWVRQFRRFFVPPSTRQRLVPLHTLVEWRELPQSGYALFFSGLHRGGFSIGLRGRTFTRVFTRCRNDDWMITFPRGTKDRGMPNGEIPAG
jgi:hypothetical protein